MTWIFVIYVLAEPGINITAPTVTVLKPSPKECQNKKTLVCVASGFYPDHVSVSWKIDGNDVKDGVATDHSAQRPKGEKFYKISSRLTVKEKDWYTLGKNFSCIVSFFNNEKTIYRTASVSGGQGMFH